MCRNIKQLYNFEPIANRKEIEDASRQFVRKISGMQNPNLENEKTFEKAILEIAKSTEDLIKNLKTNSKPKNREVELEKRKQRNQKRFFI